MEKMTTQTKSTTTYHGISLKEGQALRTDFEKQRRIYPQRKKTIEENIVLKAQWMMKLSAIAHSPPFNRKA
jgi:hypothetical protein